MTSLRSLAGCLPLLVTVTVLLDQGWVDAANTVGTEKTCSCNESEFRAVLQHYAVVLLRTIEVAIRGFLLGFGVSILQDLLFKGNDIGETETIRAKVYSRARSVGLGMAASLVGISVIFPTRFQEWTMKADLDKYY